MIFDYARFKVRLLSSHDYDNKYHKPKGKHVKHEDERWKCGGVKLEND